MLLYATHSVICVSLPGDCSFFTSQPYHVSQSYHIDIFSFAHSLLLVATYSNQWRKTGVIGYAESDKLGL